MSDSATPRPTRRLGALRQLWPFLKPHWRLAAGWLLFLGISSTATLVLPMAARQRRGQWCIELWDTGAGIAHERHQVFSRKKRIPRPAEARLWLDSVPGVTLPTFQTLPMS